MPSHPRPLSPHLGIYRWRINMAQSSLHRLTGLLLAAGALALTWGMLAAATSDHAWQVFAHFGGSWAGLVLWFAWIWAMFFHLCNGVQHLLHSVAWDYGQQAMRDRTKHPSYWKSGWIIVAVSSLLTLATWVILSMRLSGVSA